MLDLDEPRRLARAAARTPTSSCSPAIRSAVYTQVLETWVEGVKVFDRAEPEDRLCADGGYGASRDQPPRADLCCDDGDEERRR